MRLIHESDTEVTSSHLTLLSNEREIDHNEQPVGETAFKEAQADLEN